ncbi:hypothetical protein DdX_10011 [Ditylenchus destructor]|uniref:F-box domain-containing protein n=1 Tax=Ditylenchus destructor TaxID=166010 RepID=A0AAD4N0L5_9BILA|nr:hypothetical protein DdX_10011 [Ditylenchus destructor]
MSSTAAKPNFSNDTIRTCMTFLGRRQLYKLTLISRRLKQIFEENEEFAIAPYLVYDYLWYEQRQWKWITYDDKKSPFNSMPAEAVTEMATSKFLRFKNSIFVFDMDSSPFEVLPAISHIWDDRNLSLSCGNVFMPNSDLIDKISTCRKLHFKGDFSISLIPELLKGNCEIFDICDDRPPPISMPVNTVLDFLFKPVQKPNECRTVRIRANQYPDDHVCREIADKIKEKFEATSTPLNFKFAWNHNNPSGWMLASFNEETKTHLCIGVSRIGLSLVTASEGHKAQVLDEDD